MELIKCVAVLLVLCLEGGETGGGGKHHNHVKIHIPEFIHHDHHKKVITIHHHHHKPKKEHHHHHHHHKPQIPYGHHYHHHHKKVHTKTQTVSKGNGHGGHGHHGHHKKHHGHQKHHHTKHGHTAHGHEHHGHHHDAPVAPPPVSYSPIPVPSFEDDFGPAFSSNYDGGRTSNHGNPQIPQVHGITHTVKQVKVYDSLPGALPNAGGSHGYEVTEEGEEGGDDEFTAVNDIHQTFPATFHYLRSAAPQSAAHDPFAGLGAYNTVQAHDPFAPGPTSSLAAVESFGGNTNDDTFSSAAPTYHSDIPSSEYPTSFQGDTGFDGHSNSFTGTGGDSTAFASNEESPYSEETPVTFDREAGIRQTTNSGNVETIVY